jgi:3-deoxy-D-manno-octulosonic-acid transferase
MPLLYVLASYILFAVLWPVLLANPKTRAGFWRRLGLYPRGFLQAAQGPRIWLHGASAGDVQSLAPLVRGLRQKLPGCAIVFSTVTNTGRLMAARHLARDPEFADAITFAPFDLPGATRRAVAAIRPDLLVLEYTEIWPNLIRAAKAAGAKVALTNGRFDSRKRGRYRLLFGLVGNPLRELDLLLMRSDEEAERAKRLGAPSERVHATGNTKLDALPARADATSEKALRASLGVPPAGPILVAGSVHPGEEELVLGLFSRLVKRFAELHLLFAPRYLEQAPRMVAMAQANALPVRLRSQTPRGERVIVLDTMGELASLYQLATVAFVGGSFTSRGGQNVLEPAAQGKPVLFGPNVANFNESVALLKDHGGIQVANAEELHAQSEALLADAGRCAALGELAVAAVSSARGASARNVEHLARMLGDDAVSRIDR